MKKLKGYIIAAVVAVGAFIAYIFRRQAASIRAHVDANRRTADEIAARADVLAEASREIDARHHARVENIMLERHSASSIRDVDKAIETLEDGLR